MWEDLGRDPAVAEWLGLRMANILGPRRPDIIVYWADGDDAVLAHVVARELGAERGGAWLDLGRITVPAPLPAGARIALVAAEWSPSTPLAPLRVAMSSHGEVVGAVAISDLDPTPAAGSGQ
jgi:hypothetical protein